MSDSENSVEGGDSDTGLNADQGMVTRSKDKKVKDKALKSRRDDASDGNHDGSLNPSRASSRSSLGPPELAALNGDGDAGKDRGGDGTINALNNPLPSASSKGNTDKKGKGKTNKSKIPKRSDVVPGSKSTLVTNPVDRLDSERRCRPVKRSTRRRLPKLPTDAMSLVSDQVSDEASDGDFLHNGAQCSGASQRDNSDQQVSERHNKNSLPAPRFTNQRQPIRRDLDRLTSEYDSEATFEVCL
jgi:hypothetical protein